ncbi:nuclear transport factor 2 family protein [Streptomyces sp. EMB26]
MTGLISRCLRSLDEGAPKRGVARAVPTQDVVADMPVGAVHGRDAVPHRTRRGTALSDRTARPATNDGVENDGDRATVRGRPAEHARARGHTGAPSSPPVTPGPNRSGRPRAGGSPRRPCGGRGTRGRSDESPGTTKAPARPARCERDGPGPGRRALRGGPAGCGPPPRSGSGGARSCRRW